MTELRNPFIGINGYECFGCAPDNHAGLRMSFFEDGDEIISSWDPQEYFQGYNHILHGGIQATLMDEPASWIVFVKLGTAGEDPLPSLSERCCFFRGTLRLRRLSRADGP